jgi:predicted nucleotidyltransferase
MPDLFGLPQQTRAKILSVLAVYPEIQKIILYGSRAKGNFKPGSDIDLTLVAPSMNLSGLLKIESQIDDLLLPYKVDLSLFHQIENPELIEHINRVGVPFCD